MPSIFKVCARSESGDFYRGLEFIVVKKETETLQSFYASMKAQAEETIGKDLTYFSMEELNPFLPSC